MIKIIEFKLKYYNYRLIFYLLVLSGLGVALIGSAAPGTNENIRQLLGLIGGIIIMFVISLFNYEWILKLHWVYYVVCLILLTVVLLVGHNAKGATRWIRFGSAFTLQPSEFAKIFMIMFWAWLYGKNKDILKKWSTFLLSSILTIIPLLLIVAEPDLSTTILFVGMFLTCLYICGLSYKKIGICIAVLVPVAAALIIYVQTPNQILLKDYQLDRINTFINGDKDDDGKYQQKNSVLAIGSGQLSGKGLYNDSTESVKNGNYLAEAETDFIFAIVGEELGFIGSCLIIGLIILITFECILTGIRAPDLSGRIICFGMASIMTYQTFINIGVATELLPNTGIPLPFVSSGLSSLIAMYAGMGFVLNVRIRKKISLEEGLREYRFNRT